MKRTVKMGILDTIAVVAIIVCCVSLLVSSTACNGLATRSTSASDVALTREESCIEACRPYDDAYLIEYALGMVFSGTTAAAGTSGVLSATLADEQGADIALAATAAGSGIATVVLWWLAGESAERYTECVERCRPVAAADLVP